MVDGIFQHFSQVPTHAPTISAYPTSAPSTDPSSVPSSIPSIPPTIVPSGQPSVFPTISQVPTSPSAEPTSVPSTEPSNHPSASPTSTNEPTSPTSLPTLEPTLAKEDLSSESSDTVSLPPTAIFFITAAGVGTFLTAYYFYDARQRKNTAEKNARSKYTPASKKSRKTVEVPTADSDVYADGGIDLGNIYIGEDDASQFSSGSRDVQTLQSSPQGSPKSGSSSTLLPKQRSGKQYSNMGMNPAVRQRSKSPSRSSSFSLKSTADESTSFSL